MARIEKTVFISYRRTNIPWALAIFQYLTAHGYNVFFDYTSISSGDFERVILENIKARAHFIVILTPSALERCENTEDWLRREIETALDTKRNIIPLMLEGFDFRSPSIAKCLTGKLAGLKRYNALNVPADYFEEAMSRLCMHYLNVPLEAVLHPISNAAREAVREQQISAAGAAPVEIKQLTAQEWFEKGYKLADNSDEEILCYTEAIRLQPDFAIAYYNRGNVHDTRGDLNGALKDYTEAIRLQPDLADAYYNRGLARDSRGDLDGAFTDYTEAIRLRPNASVYCNRGIVREGKGDLDGALEDYTAAIHLQPDDATAYYNRGITRKIKGDLDGALRDYTEAIRLQPNHANAYYNRALIWTKKDDCYAALADFQKYLDLGEGIRQGDQKEVEDRIAELKAKLNK